MKAFLRLLPVQAIHKNFSYSVATATPAKAAGNIFNAFTFHTELFRIAKRLDKIAIFNKRFTASLIIFGPPSNEYIMTTKLNHVSIFVLDQDSAFEFYVNKLGFKVHTDAPMGPGMRWLTVCPPEQPDLEIALMSIEDGIMFKNGSGETDERTCEKGNIRLRRVRMQ